MVGKGKQIQLEQVDFVHKPKQHLIIESRSNLTIRLLIKFSTTGLLNQQTESFFHP